MSETVAKKRGAGRPKGSKTRNDPVVEEHPPSCPGCGSTKRSEKRQIREPLRLGEVTVRWSRVSCLDCPQVYVIRTRELQPE